MIGGGESAGEAVAGTVGLLGDEKNIQRLLEPALEEVGVTVKRDETLGAEAGFLREVKSVDRKEEKERAHAFVEVVAVPAEGVKFAGLGEEFRQRGVAAKRVERLIAFGGVGSGDDRDEFTGHER